MIAPDVAPEVAPVLAPVAAKVPDIPARVLAKPARVAAPVLGEIAGGLAPAGAELLGRDLSLFQRATVGAQGLTIVKRILTALLPEAPDVTSMFLPQVSDILAALLSEVAHGFLPFRRLGSGRPLNAFGFRVNGLLRRGDDGA